MSNQENWAITPQLSAALQTLLRPGMRTLECGSGLSTRIFERAGCRHTALEHDPRFADAARRQYGVESVVEAPLLGDPPWYDWQPTDLYDLILVDGPTADGGGRRGILRVLADCLKPETVIVLDDTNRPADRRLAVEIAARWGFEIEERAEAPRGYIILRRRPRRFGQLSVSVITRCNQACRYCGEQPLRSARPHYEMTLDQVERLIVRCRELQVGYDRIMLTGGEPTVWPHLVQAAIMLRSSGIASLLGFYTNGVEADVIDSVAVLFDGIRIGVAERTRLAAARLARRHGNRIHIYDASFRQPPSEPLENVLPAVCGCPHQGYFDGRLYTCAPAASRLAILGRPLDDPDCSCSVEEDFGRFQAEYLETKPQRLQICTLCTVCIFNGHVWKRQAETESPRDA